MKSVLKKSYLLGLLLLWIFLIVGFISITNWNWNVIINTAPDDSEHRVMLHSLYLKEDVDDAFMRTDTGEKNLKVLDWLAVWGTVSLGSMSSIVWWTGNKITSAIWWGIWWWITNFVNLWSYSVIGGGNINKTYGDNSVAVWGYNWTARNGWVVLWWENGSGGIRWVVLGGSSNTAWENSLAFWKNARWEKNSFAWNDKAEANTARINADSWVLIWTYNPIDGVSLVVSWSVKLGSGKAGRWAINYNGNWCITMYDWKNSHVLGKKSSKEPSCGVSSWCKFGGVLLQNWDVVTGYTVSYSTNCNEKRVKITCENWNLLWWLYPYCYDISSDSRYWGGN